jgi:GntR family transcriptional regulator, rspAB operon transcriptional repressor
MARFVISREQRAHRSAVWQQVYALVRAAIVAVEYEPGQRLSENDLADQLGVSRTPIREALVRLRDDGLVSIVPQLGTFVTLINPAAVSDAQFVRESLECGAVRIAASRATPENTERLWLLLERQAATNQTGDLDRFYVLDDELHNAICTLSGHGIAWSLSQRASGHLNRIRRLSLSQPEYIGTMISEHHDVVDALAARRPAAAERALRHHLRTVLSGLPKIQESHPEYFESQRPA